MQPLATAKRGDVELQSKEMRSERGHPRVQEVAILKEFDPYQQWFGIPLNEQPPDHYRLLGIPRFTEGPELIENAANQRLAYLRTVQAGQQTGELQRLLSEVLAARFCLLSPTHKAAYDRWLSQRIQPRNGPADERLLARAEEIDTRQRLQPRNGPADRSEADAIDPGLAAVFEARIPSTSGISSKGRRKKSRRKAALLNAAATVTVVALGLAGLWWAVGHGLAPNDEGIAKAVDPVMSPSPEEEALPKSLQPLEKDTSTPADQGAKNKSKAFDPKAAPGSKPPKPEAMAETKPQPDEGTTIDAKLAAAALPVENPEPATAGRLVPPSAGEQKRLMGEIDEVYKPGEAKDLTAKAELARKLLEDGRKDEGNPAEKFVLFRRAGEIACDTGEADLMLEAVDAIVAAGFDIRPVQVKSRLLKKLVSQNTLDSAAQLSVVGASCVKFAEEAAASGAVEEALDVLAVAQNSMAKPMTRAQADLRAAKAAMTRARTPADKAEREQKAGEAQAELDAVKSAQSALAKCAENLQLARRERAALQAAQRRLETVPDDPEACLAVGRWYCFHQGDWDKGLKLLALGNDAALKSLASEELASKPTKAEDKVARGDAWWDLAEKATGKVKDAMRLRAGHWYQEALPDLAPGLRKSRVEKRLGRAAEGPSEASEGATIARSGNPSRPE